MVRLAWSRTSTLWSVSSQFQQRKFPYLLLIVIKLFNLDLTNFSTVDWGFSRAQFSSGQGRLISTLSWSPIQWQFNWSSAIKPQVQFGLVGGVAGVLRLYFCLSYGNLHPPLILLLQAEELSQNTPFDAHTFMEEYRWKLWCGGIRLRVDCMAYRNLMRLVVSLTLSGCGDHFTSDRQRLSLE